MNLFEHGRVGLRRPPKGPRDLRIGVGRRLLICLGGLRVEMARLPLDLRGLWIEMTPLSMRRIRLA